MAKNVLVTGGAGFVGSHLTDALLAAGHNVRVLDSLAPQVHACGVPAYFSEEAELLIGDIRHPEVVRRAVEHVDVIFHLAAAVGVGQSMYEIAHYMGTNTQGTAVLLQELLRHRDRLEKLVVASSMSIYGEGKYLCGRCGESAPLLRSPEQLRNKQWEPVCAQCGDALTPLSTNEGKPLQCSSIYALSKKDQEEMCLLYGRTYDLPVVALRYFNIYGERQALSNPYTGVAAIFASSLLNGHAPLVFEDGAQLRDFVSVKDIVRANLQAMQGSQANGFAMNIGSGTSVSIREVAELLAQAMEREIAVKPSGKFRAGDIRHCFADISLARTVLGYSPQVEFADGIRDLVQWLRSQRPTDRAEEAAVQLSYFGLTA